MEEMMRAKIRKLAANLLLLLSLLAWPIAGLGQVQIKAPSNPYSPAKDVELGKQAAAEVERQLPLIDDYEVERYVSRIGQRLVESIPRGFQHPEFRYSFRVVNVRDLNAFALPGGFTFVNRGMIEAARSEGELAGVMAHEISHVALRHGTAQQAKAQKYAIGAAAGQILGAIIGGGLGSVIAQGSQFGIGTYFLKFSREYERQADALGAMIMADAGYDPRDLANVFRMLERQGGNGAPEWLSSHPNPGNRYEAIMREAAQLQVRNPVRNTEDFFLIQARLRRMPRAPSMEEIARGRGRLPQGRTRRTSSRAGEMPSRTFETFQASDGLFKIGYPSNWEVFSQSGADATFAPSWALDGNEVTRGAIVGYFEAHQQLSTRLNLDEAMDTVIAQFRQSNPDLREEWGARYGGQLSGRESLATFLNSRNTMGEAERDWLIVRPIAQGFIYVIFIAPEREFTQLRPTFEAMIRSFRASDR
jgi:Zn-dependent protease with chaperone function